MKPEFKIEGREATPAEYRDLMEALLASQAATPTARACAHEEGEATTPTLLDTLFPENAAPAPHAPHADSAKDGEQPVYPRVSGFLEAGAPTHAASEAPRRAATGRYE